MGDINNTELTAKFMATSQSTSAELKSTGSILNNIARYGLSQSIVTDLETRIDDTPFTSAFPLGMYSKDISKDTLPMSYRAALSVGAEILADTCKAYVESVRKHADLIVAGADALVELQEEASVGKVMSGVSKHSDMIIFSREWHRLFNTGLDHAIELNPELVTGYAEQVAYLVSFIEGLKDNLSLWASLNKEYRVHIEHLNYDSADACIVKMQDALGKYISDRWSSSNQLPIHDSLSASESYVMPDAPELDDLEVPTSPTLSHMLMAGESISNGEDKRTDVAEQSKGSGLLAILKLVPNAGELTKTVKVAFSELLEELTRLETNFVMEHRGESEEFMDDPERQVMADAFSDAAKINIITIQLISSDMLSIGLAINNMRVITSRAKVMSLTLDTYR